MLHLRIERHRVFNLELPLAQHLRPTLLLPTIIREPHHIRHAQARPCTENAVEILPRPGDHRVLARAGLEVERAGRRIADHEGAHRARREAQDDGRALFGSEGARRRAAFGVHTDDGAEQVVQDVDLVDEVDEDDAACGALAPLCGRGEIRGRFVGCPEAGDGDDVAEGGVGVQGG